MNALSVRLKDESSESFGQVICVLFLGWALDNCQPSVWVAFFVVDVRPKEMVFCVEVSAARCETLVRCEQVSALIVLEDLALERLAGDSYGGNRQAVEDHC